MTSENGTKSFDGDLVERRSVIEPPTDTYPTPGIADASSLFWLIGQFADEIAPFGRGKLRDTQLRAFITQENIFASALGIICSRNSGFAWKLEGPPRTVSVIQEIFNMANLGRGWQNLIVQTSIDLYTQDFGAFWEIVREERRPDSPIIGINHLDAARCWHTGLWDTPVIYQDWKGQYHILNYFDVLTFAEMPVPYERYYGMQFCALTRLLRGAQEQKNIATYKYEKTGGRNTRAIHLVKGVTSQQLTDAITRARAEADSAGLSRFMNPIVVGTLDPKADVGHDTIELIGLPEQYDEKLNFDHYLNLIAMAFESDYQEFAPLPGGGLGTGAQSEMLHLKARGKGPLNFMSLISHSINTRLLPKNTKFLWAEQDLEAEKSDAEVRAIRAQTRAVRIASFEITPQVARQIANDEGDLPLELMQLMAEDDITPEVTIDNNSSASSQLRTPVEPGEAGQPARVPVIRPPQPLGPKQGPGLKEIQEGLSELQNITDIKERGSAILKILAKLNQNA